MVAGLLVSPAVATAGDDALERHRPLLRYDGDERHFALPVEAAVRGRSGDRLLLDTEARGPAVVYGRESRDAGGRRWLQYWLFFANNPQDRGVVRTGRHEGDWELLQIRLARDGEPVEATLAQHTWAEGCSWRELQRREGTPVVFVANGSHALYSRAGEQDRPFPDPNDEADGLGRAVRPRLVRIGPESHEWMRFGGTFGASESGWIPGEQASPRGPAFQSARWDDPGGFHDRDARLCGAGPPGRPWQTAVVVGLIVLAGAALLWRRRRSSGQPDLQSPR